MGRIRMKKKYFVIGIPILIISVISGIFYYNYTVEKAHQESIQNKEKYKEIDELIERVNQRVDKVSNIVLSESDGEAVNIKKFMQLAYPEDKIENKEKITDCEKINTGGIICIRDNDSYPININKTYAFKDIPFTIETSTLRFFIPRYEEGKSNIQEYEKSGNTNVCKFARNNKNTQTEVERFLLILDYDTGRPGGILNSLNEFFVDCVSENDLREQLLTRKYKEMTPVLKCWMEEYLYTNKIFHQKVKYVR